MNSFLNPVELSIAPKLLRFANYLIDVVAFLLFILIIMIVLLLFQVDVVTFFNQNPLFDRILTAIFYFAFMSFQELIFKGRSIGKFITGTIAVTEDGSQMEIGKILNRNICRLIPFDALSYFGNTGWHDSISKTRVVNKKEFDKLQLKKDSIDQIGQIADPI